MTLGFQRFPKIHEMQKNAPPLPKHFGPLFTLHFRLLYAGNNKTQVKAIYRNLQAIPFVK